MTNAKRIKMERVKKEFNRYVRIWSGEWDAYWRPGANGYTTERKDAGYWTLQAAYRATSHCGPEKKIFFERV